MDGINSEHVSALVALPADIPVVAADMDKCVCEIRGERPARVNKTLNDRQRESGKNRAVSTRL